MLDALAISIVDQVRKRGPFLSLSEFVNRQLSSDKTLAIAGTIQVALNNLGDSSSLYKGVVDTYAAANKYSNSSVPNAGYNFKEAAAGIAVYGMPGWMRQADVLRPLAPIISARDDTFTIRTYGDARDSSGTVLASTYCEATVRRTRNYCDPLDKADSADVPTVRTNKQFGRRFEIVSFRWIAKAEIRRPISTIQSP